MGPTAFTMQMDCDRDSWTCTTAVQATLSVSGSSGSVLTHTHVLRENLYSSSHLWKAAPLHVHFIRSPAGPRNWIHMHRFTLRQQLFTYLFTHSFTYPFHLTARPAVQLKVYPSIPSRWLLCTSLIQVGADKLLHFYFHFTERKPSTEIGVGDIQVKMKFVNRYKFFIYSLFFCFFVFVWTSHCFSVAWVYNLNWMWWVKTDYAPQNNSKIIARDNYLGNYWVILGLTVHFLLCN